MSAADVRAGKLFMISKYIVEEDLTDQIDGSVASFTLNSNYRSGSVRIFHNGLRIRKGIGKDAKEDGGDTVSFGFTPEIGDEIVVDYIKL